MVVRVLERAVLRNTEQIGGGDIYTQMLCVEWGPHIVPIHHFHTHLKFQLEHKDRIVPCLWLAP